MPAVPPVTVPDTTEAIVELLLLHAPPLVVFVSAVVRPEHTVRVPVIAAGNGFTVNVVTALQPVGKV